MKTPAEKLHFAVFFYAFNDIDHISPVAWKLLQSGHRVTGVVLDPDYAIAGDARLDFLKTQGDFSIQPVSRALPLAGINWLFRQTGSETRGFARRAALKILRKLGILRRLAHGFLANLSPDVCIFEWGTVGGHNRADFHAAAKALTIPSACLPHGLNIFLNAVINDGIAKSTVQLADYRRNYSDYDLYVYQSEFHRGRGVRQGQDADITRALGSARYCPEWSARLREIYPPYKPARETAGRLKVVFMLTHWTYNVDRDATLGAVREMARSDAIHLVVKDHTRGTGSLPADMRAAFSGLPAAEADTATPSVALIEWADVVICFGSSIGIEALVQGKHLLNPRYMHSNQTIFEETGASLETNSLEETMALLKKIGDQDGETFSPPGKDRLFEMVVYGGRAPFDVLQGYLENLESLARR